MSKVLITDHIDPIAIEMLEAERFDVSVKTDLTPEQLKHEIQDVDVLIVRSKTKVTSEILAASKSLKIIGRAGVALDNIDVKTAEAKNIKVLNSPEASTISVAELAMGGILSCARNISRADRSMKAGKWIKKELKGTEIKGKTLGIIGLGRIGLALAKIAQGFGMNVIGFDILPDCIDNARNCGVGINTLDEVLAVCDFVSLHIPLTESTKKLVCKAQLTKMKSSAVIVNTARGGVIDENDLLDALNSGTIAMAFLDVFSEEPPVNPLLKKLISHPKVIASPHIGASTKEALKANSTIIVDKILQILKRTPK
ncbi:MAG: hydroxyacid dehydrogenase [Candidatus Ranarchaeia archaeon]|jgi:D-3-phosphoglycerate dehydrogenase